MSSDQQCKLTQLKQRIRACQLRTWAPDETNDLRILMDRTTLVTKMSDIVPLEQEFRRIVEMLTYRSALMMTHPLWAVVCNVAELAQRFG